MIKQIVSLIYTNDKSLGISYDQGILILKNIILFIDYKNINILPSAQPGKFARLKYDSLDKRVYIYVNLL
jgi:hypothetical protein